jgi:antitoxin component of RelBE/YafQ-DinJ toxin-antitoxin module
MSQALRLVLATIASIGGMPTSLTNNSASLPCQRPWLKAEALPVSLLLITGMPRSRRIAKHLEGGVELRAQAIPHPIT